MIFVKSEDLKYGMRIAKPIYNKSGVLLYERNTRLTLQGIESVKNFGLLGLYILEPAEPVPPMSEEDLDFERFQTMAVFSIREELDNLIAGKEPVNLKRLAMAIITNYGRLDHKISFTQNLRSTTDYIYKHVINTAILCALMSSQMHFTPTEQEELVMAALLHDIGKLLLPNKVREKYDDYDTNDLIIVRKFQSDGLGLIRPEMGIDSGIRRIVAQIHKMEYGDGREDAGKILKAIGIDADPRLIICEVPACHPFVSVEMMMPILPIVRVKDIDEAIELAVKAEHGCRHSAHIHSKNVDRLTRFAREVETTIFVKNAPSYAGIGAGGEGYTTFTIAGPTGEGLTAAHSFTRQRRCVLVDGFHIV